MPTKQQLIEDAYGELGLATYSFDIEPEELQAGLRKLNAMWATWESKGIQVGFNFPGTLNDDSNLPDYAVEPTVCELAVRIAPGKGKVVSPDTKRNTLDGVKSLFASAAMPREQQLRSTLPRGAGNKSWRGPCSPFYPAADDDPLQADSPDDLTIIEP